MTIEAGASSQELPTATSVLAVCAHPDDESFGLGGLVSRFVENGAEVALLCFTRGEASTLGSSDVGLGELRRAELIHAATELGARRVELVDHHDGSLASEPLDQLAGEVAAMVDAVGADLLLVFDEGGVTGHPDHCRATDAALAGAPGLPVLAWVVPWRAADALNTQFHTGFVGRHEEEIDIVLTVDRARQHRAIACHRSQCTDNPVLERRLTLLGDTESLRWLRQPGSDLYAPPGGRDAPAMPDRPAP